MTNSKTTRKALLSSALALTLCVAMLIATTFAWFTDTASTSVNKIQAGTLDVALEMATEWNADGSVKTWAPAEGETLEFRKATGTSNDDAVLWEPGCTYTLPELRVVNKGNLALKYKILITGIQGDAKLNEAIVWTISDNDLGSDHSLAANATSETLTIKGHMKEEAGNEYQDLSIDGISITVYAAQDTVENDSYSDQYDVSAMYPLMPTVDAVATKATSVDADSKLTKEVKMNGSTIPAGTALYTNSNKDDNNKVTASSEGTLTETIKTTASTNDANTITVSIDYTYTVGESESQVHGFSNAIKHTLSLSKGLESVTVKHGETNMEASSSAESLTDGKYFYDKTAGTLTIVSSTYSNFYVTIEHGFKAAVGGQGYGSFAEAVKAAKDGQTITLLENDEVNSSDYNVDNRLKVEKNNVTIDLNQKTLTVPNYTLILNGDNITLKNGEMKTTTTNENETNGSYAVVPWGKNTIIDGVNMLGGINVTGDSSSSADRDTTVEITNCEITATNYYTVCAQRNAEATIENTKLIGGAGTFFWVEQYGYSEGGAPLANVSSKIIYDAKTVKFEGNNGLYNPVGVAVVVKNLTVKDAEGDAQTIDAVAVSTEAHLRTLVAAGENVMLASDITLSKPLEISKTVTIIGNNHTLTLGTDGGNCVINCNANNDTIVLTLNGVKIEASEIGPGISVAANNNVTIIMDNCEVSADGGAIDINKTGTSGEVVIRDTTIKGCGTFVSWPSAISFSSENCKFG